MVFTWDFWNRNFFGRGEVSPTHAADWRLVVGSQAKHHVSSPVTLFLKKSGSLSAVAIKSQQAAIPQSFCSEVKECGTMHEQIFCFRKSSTTIFLTVSLPMFTSSASILSKRWWFWSNNWEIFSTLLYLCSIFKSKMRLSHTASFHATNHKYCSIHSDNTKYTTCQDLLLRVSVGECLMAHVVFALHNQS